MKKGLFVLLLCFSAGFAESEAIEVVNDIPGYQLLPEPYYQVYVHGYEVSNESQPGDVTVRLPIRSHKKINPGCYIACYSHDGGAFATSEDTYMVGQIRVWGSYSTASKRCEPHNYEDRDFGHEKYFSELCGEYFLECEDGSCWVDGNTAGWFQWGKIKIQTVGIDKKLESNLAESAAVDTA